MTIPAISMSGLKLPQLLQGTGQGTGAFGGILSQLGGLGAQGAKGEGSGGLLGGSMLDGLFQGMQSSDGLLEKVQNMMSEFGAAAGIDSEFFGEDGTFDVEGFLAQGGSITLKQVTVVVIQEVTTLSSQGQGLNSLANVDELAFAYQQLGYSKEEALDKANSVKTVMDMLDKRMDEAQEIADMLLEVMTQNRQDVQALQIQNLTQQTQMRQTYAAFQQISLTTSLSSDLSSRVLKGQSLTGEGGPKLPNLNMAAEEGTARSMLDDGAVPATKGVKEGSVEAQLARSADNIMKALAKTEEGVLDSKALKRVQQLATQRPGEGLQQAVERLQMQSGQQNIQAGAPTSSDAALLASGATESLEEGMRLRKEGIEGRREQTANNLMSRDDATKPETNQAIKKASLDQMTQPVNSQSAAKVYQVKTTSDGSLQLVDPDTGLVVDGGAPRAENPAAQNSQQASFAERMAQMAANAKLAQQVRVHVRTVAGHGGGKVNVALNPPELGRVEVSMSIKDGEVTGSVTVQRPEVMEQLARDLKVLEQGLAEAGLTLGKDGLSFQLEQQGTNANQHGNQGQTGTRGNSAVVMDDAQLTEAVWSNPDRILDLEI